MAYSTDEFKGLSRTGTRVFRCTSGDTFLNDPGRWTDEPSASTGFARVTSHVRGQPCTTPEAHTHPEYVSSMVHARIYPSTTPNWVHALKRC